MSEQIFTIHSLEEYPAAAKWFTGFLQRGNIFAFYGKMGTGKTTFIKSLCEAMGVEDAINSPTFAIVNEYADACGETIYHFDFYRIKNLGEVMDLGFEDYAYSGNLCLMEWPELIEELLPEDTTNVHIAETENGMRIVSID